MNGALGMGDLEIANHKSDCFFRKATHLLSSSSVFPVPHLLVLSPSSAEYLQCFFLLQFPPEYRPCGREASPYQPPPPATAPLCLGEEDQTTGGASHYVGFWLVWGCKQKEARAGNYRNHDQLFYLGQV